MAETVSLDKIKEEILENAQTYFKTTGETVDDNFLLLLISSLFDEYKARRNYPAYFTNKQIEADVKSYFVRKKAYFAMKVIPAMIGKIGAEGLSSLLDNGVSRVFAADGYFYDVIPYCEVL